VSGPLATEGSPATKSTRCGLSRSTPRAASPAEKWNSSSATMRKTENPLPALVTCGQARHDDLLQFTYCKQPGHPAARAQGPPLIIPSPTLCPTPDSYDFRSVQPTRHNRDARFLSENGIRKLGMVVATDATGEAEVNAAREGFTRLNNIRTEDRPHRSPCHGRIDQLPLVAGRMSCRLCLLFGCGGGYRLKSFKNLGLQQPMIVS